MLRGELLTEAPLPQAELVLDGASAIEGWSIAREADRTVAVAREA